MGASAPALVVGSVGMSSLSGRTTSCGGLMRSWGRRRHISPGRSSTAGRS